MSIELKIVFDTNVLHTKVAHQLINTSTAEFIRANNDKEGIHTTWIIPKVVIAERRFQMQTKSKEFFPSLHSLERIIGHNLGITEEIISNRIDEAIIQEVRSNNITTVELDYGRVDVRDAENRSVNRLIPFEITDSKEKGFRDYLIGNTFKQILEASPTTPRICRVIFVCNDKRLIEYAQELIGTRANAWVYDNLDDVGSIIQTLSSDLDMELWDRIQLLVSQYFFNPEEKTGLYYKLKVRAAIDEKFKTELSSKPILSHSRINGGWKIGRPTFVKKVNQKLSFETRIYVEYKIMSKQDAAPSTFATTLAGLTPSTRESTQSSVLASLFESPPASQAIASGIGKGLASALLAKFAIDTLESPKLIESETGKTEFIVKWSITLTTAGKLSQGKINSIDYLPPKQIDEQDS